jgi:hypothetical protein
MSLYTVSKGQVGWPYSASQETRLERALRRLRRRTKAVSSLLALTGVTAFLVATGLALALLWPQVRAALFVTGV